MELSETELKTLRDGCTVKVVKGRNVPKNTIAKVTRIFKSDGYVTVYLDNGMKTYASNVLIEYKGAYIKAI